MSGWLIALTGCIYFYVSLEQIYRGNTGMSIAYLGYAFSNIGLYMLASKQEREMKEPEKIPLDPETPRPNEVKKIPMPSLYPEKISQKNSPVKFVKKIVKKKIENQLFFQKKYFLMVILRVTLMAN